VLWPRGAQMNYRPREPAPVFPSPQRNDTQGEIPEARWVSQRRRVAVEVAGCSTLPGLAIIVQQARLIFRCRTSLAGRVTGRDAVESGRSAQPRDITSSRS